MNSIFCPLHSKIMWFYYSRVGKKKKQKTQNVNAGYSWNQTGTTYLPHMTMIDPNYYLVAHNRRCRPSSFHVTSPPTHSGLHLHFQDPYGKSFTNKLHTTRVLIFFFPLNFQIFYYNLDQLIFCQCVNVSCFTIC